jgi:hypothetical protein
LPWFAYTRKRRSMLPGLEPGTVTAMIVAHGSHTVAFANSARTSNELLTQILLHISVNTGGSGRTRTCGVYPMGVTFTA